MGEKLYSEKFLESADKECAKYNQRVDNSNDYVVVICEDCHDHFRKPKQARTTRCCVCRKKRRAIKTGRGGMEVKPGYPEPLAFQTIEAIEEYFSGDSLTCLLCGNEFKQLAKHLSSIHVISVRDYQLRFGLPLTHGLVGATTRANAIVRASSEGYLNGITGNGGNGGWKGGYKHAPALIEKQKQAVSKAAKNNPNLVTYRNKPITGYCSMCGDELPEKVPEHVMITHGCKILCKNCKK